MLSVLNQEAKHLETGFLGQCAKRNDCLWYVHMSRNIDICATEVKSTMRVGALHAKYKACWIDLSVPLAGNVRRAQSELMELAA